MGVPFVPFGLMGDDNPAAKKLLRRWALCFAALQVGKAAREAGLGSGLAGRLLNALRRSIATRTSKRNDDRSGRRDDDRSHSGGSAGRGDVQRTDPREAKLEELRAQVAKDGCTSEGDARSGVCLRIAAAHASEKGDGGGDDRVCGRRRTRRSREGGEDASKRKDVTWEDEQLLPSRGGDVGSSEVGLHARSEEDEDEDQTNDYAASALDEVALALAMEGDGAASERVAAMALRVAKAPAPRPSTMPSSRLTPPAAPPLSIAAGSKATSPPPVEAPTPDECADAAFDLAARALAMEGGDRYAVDGVEWEGASGDDGSNADPGENLLGDAPSEGGVGGRGPLPRGGGEPDDRRQEKDEERTGHRVGASAAIFARSAPTLRLEVFGGVAWGSAAAAGGASSDVMSLRVGRTETNDLVVDDSEVSSSHAEVRWRQPARGDGEGDGAWYVADCGSTNGTFLNDELIGRGRMEGERWHVVRDGDLVRLGERSESPTLRVSVEAACPAGQGSATFLRLRQGLVSLGEKARDLRWRVERNADCPIDAMRFSRRLFSIETQTDDPTERASVRASPGKPPRMEDRALCECPLRGHSQVGLFAVFDGHAGAEGAIRAKEILPAALARLLGGRTPGARGAADALRAAFLETDREMDCEYEGTTATAMLTWRCQSTGRLYAQTANVGDSSCALGRIGVGGSRGRFTTTEHKVSSARERERLARDHGVVLSEGTTRLYGLALARALGDGFLKREGAGISAEPDVSEVVELRGDGNDVAVLASDGLWDVCSAEQAVATASGAGSPSAAAGRLVLFARQMRSRDDAAVVVVRL